MCAGAEDFQFDPHDRDVLDRAIESGHWHKAQPRRSTSRQFAGDVIGLFCVTFLLSFAFYGWLFG